MLQSVICLFFYLELDDYGWVGSHSEALSLLCVCSILGFLSSTLWVLCQTV